MGVDFDSVCGGAGSVSSAEGYDYDCGVAGVY